MGLNLLAVSIGIGLVVSLLFSELFGLAAGGLVVPGYVALYLTRPIDLGATLAAALFTLFFVRILATFIIVYGRRRTALMILVGYATGVVANALLGVAFEATTAVAPPPIAPGGVAAALTTAAPRYSELDSQVIGYIVPGLIAIWLDRQGVLSTLAALLTSAVVVRLVLILVVPEDLRWFDARTTRVIVEEQSER